MLLGAQLRRLREDKGVSREDAGWAIRASESKISRMELGRVGFKDRDVADLLTLYGVADADAPSPSTARVSHETDRFTGPVQTPVRVNVTWVTPLGEEVASTR